MRTVDRACISATQIAVAMILFASYASSLWAQMAFGNCNIQIRAEKLENTTINVGRACPDDPNKSLRIAYYWIDGRAFSIMSQGLNHGRLKVLMGERPVILQNATYKTASEFISKFSSTMTSSNFQGDYFTFNLDAPGNSGQTFRGKFEALSKQTLSARIYNATSEFQSLDTDASTTALKSNRLAQGYSTYFIDTVGGLELESVDQSKRGIEASGMFNRLVFWRYTTREELKEYTKTLNGIRKRVTSPDMEALGHLPFERLASLGRNMSIDAMLHLTTKNWPPDFLVTLGRFTGHGSLDKISLDIPPRRILILIAVIENVSESTSPFIINGIQARRLENDGLVRLAEAKPTIAETIPFPPERLARGERIIVPLRIEAQPNFTVGREDAPQVLLPDQTITKRALAMLKKYPPQQVFLSQPDGPGFLAPTKVNLDLQRVAIPATTNTYVFGPAYELESIVINQQPLRLRQIDPNKLTMVAGYLGGSCPHLLFETPDARNEPIEVGPILTAHGSPRNRGIHEVEIPPGITKVRIEEREAERTTIRSMAFFVESGNREKRLLVKHNMTFTLDNGEAIRFEVPAPKLRPGEKLKLVIDGYYESYSTLVAKQPRSNSTIERKPL
jgi:hypothetical protein